LKLEGGEVGFFWGSFFTEGFRGEISKGVVGTFPFGRQFPWLVLGGAAIGLLKSQLAP
jgi:hypothetical protein